VSLIAALTEEFTSRQIMAEQFPMLTRHGIPDTDRTIHSHFLSYLTVLAQALNYSGVVECPLPVVPHNSWAALGDVRPDVVWFAREDNAPVAAFEFERFDRGDEARLRHKMENLNIAYLQSDRRLRLAVLVYWVRSGVAARTLREVSRGYRTGFVRNGVRVPAGGCPLHVFKCTWRVVGDGTSAGLRTALVVSDILPIEVS